MSVDESVLSDDTGLVHCSSSSVSSPSISVSHWWRQQPNSWADDFKTVVEEISLVRVNSAMVERLWSMYNARHKDHGHAFGPGERQRVVKKRWAAVHRRGGR